LRNEEAAKSEGQRGRRQKTGVSKKKGNACAKIIHEPSSIAAAPFISLMIDQYRQ
jgi:hypothetical protein